MQPVYKCDYCKFTGTKEEVENHEKECTDNYDKKSCFTCIHKRLNVNSTLKFECEAGNFIPDNHIIENCNLYKRKTKVINTDFLGNLFGSVNH